MVHSPKTPFAAFFAKKNGVWTLICFVFPINLQFLHFKCSHRLYTSLILHFCNINVFLPFSFPINLHFCKINGLSLSLILFFPCFKQFCTQNGIITITYTFFLHNCIKHGAPAKTLHFIFKIAKKMYFYRFFFIKMPAVLFLPSVGKKFSKILITSNPDFS